MKRLLLLVGAGIAAVAFVLPVPAAAGGGCHGVFTPDAQGVSVRIREICFDPLVIRVAKGGTITWRNADPMAHNITGAAFAWGSFDEVRPGAAVSFRFDNDGVYPYACTLHPGMVGAVVVGRGVRAAGALLTRSDVTLVRLKPAPSAPSASISPPEAAAESSNPAAIAAAVSPAARAQPPIPAMRPSPAVHAAQAAPAARGGLIVGALAVGGALVLAAVALYARRSPSQRELVG